MKKFLLVLVAFMTVIFTGCANKEVKNEFGWYTDYDACLKQAKAENKKVFLIVSRDESDNVSATLKQTVLYTSEFAEKYSGEYLFCEVDISPSLFKAAKPPKDADKEAKKNSKKFEKILDERMRVVTIYGIQNTPTIFMLSPEGYVIKDFTYIPCANVGEFDALLSTYNEEISGMQGMIEEVKATSGLEKVSAIDALYEGTNSTYRYLLTDLMREVEKLDKKNETGLVGKYIMAIATSDAMDAYMARKPEKVASIYEKSAKHKMLTDDQKQQSYYAAAFVVGSNTPTPEETKQIISYLEKAIEINPESNIGKHCAGLLETVKEFKVRQDEAEAQKKAQEAEEKKNKKKSTAEETAPVEE